jgi:hypothetical protein
MGKTNKTVIKSNSSLKKDVLIDQGNRTRKGVVSKRKTSSKHFDNYLDYEGCEYKHLDDIPEEWFTEERIGKYSSYLFTQVPTIQKFNSHDQYLSSFYSQITQKYRRFKLEFEDYYTKLRMNIKQDWLERCAKDKKPFQNHTALGYVEDIEYFCLKEFELEDEGCEERSIISFDYTGLGRISECTSMQYDSLQCFGHKLRKNPHALYVN